MTWSEFNAMWLTQCACPSSERTRIPLSGFHTLIVRSSLPLYIRPEPPQRTQVTLLVCPVKTSVTALVTASQILRDASFEAVTSLLLTPSFDRWIGSHDKLVIHLVCPFSGLPAGCPLAGSHNLASLSMLPDAASFPSGENAQHKTQLVWPFMVVIGVSVFISHTLKVASPEPVMRRLQSGENATQRMASVCPANVPVHLVTAMTRNVA
mmetsp:Transcript_42324/g.133344  ORF Transcript_42324/g.133344 Transcript_42324/m.133344 type:complete len:209 (-) Transcript_42324:242-868(-)